MTDHHKEHTYRTTVTWTGDNGTGTSGYKAYRRDNEISVTGKPTIPGSADPAFRGDASRYNPEELLVAAVSQCHMLWYLHLCAVAGVVVRGYVDDARGTMVESEDGSGHFTEVVLHPRVLVSPDSDVERAVRLHEKAHAMCYVANSVNFRVACEPEITHA